eukprot:TRINITY_DN6933_c0_g1_i8.p1 TRINITY_DN6933_c0_g1~~TRINITY_DN6933_c0_g1_i8.p1  ORF type:complete len:223 (-),score=43.90 TRINITY_DN6933_c0_g1_i8:38-706(-)
MTFADGGYGGVGGMPAQFIFAPQTHAKYQYGTAAAPKAMYLMQAAHAMDFANLWTHPSPAAVAAAAAAAAQTNCVQLALALNKAATLADDATAAHREFVQAATLAEVSTAAHRKYAQDAIVVCIWQLSGEVWSTLPAAHFETVASVLKKCPQPKQRWPGDRFTEHILLLGMRELRKFETMSDLLAEQEDVDEGGRQLNLTLCVESLRNIRPRLTNMKLHTTR